MRCDYSGGIRNDRVPVVSDQGAGGHGRVNRPLKGIPGMDVTVRLAVIGRITADVAIAPRAAHVFGGQGSRLARLGMCVPFTENLGAPRDQERRSCGVGRARIRFRAAPPLDDGTANCTFVDEDESKILVSLRARSVERELLAHVRIHHILWAFESGRDPVGKRFPRLGGRDECQQDTNYFAPPTDTAHDQLPRFPLDGLGVHLVTRIFSSWCGA